ncbi:MAG: putative toxin-antitoxin system toxin component, PIN family [Ginsengibacter sp.]
MFLEAVAKNIEILPIHFLCKDSKDNFLLDLIDFSKANFLVTGDRELLKLNPFASASILTPANFAEVIV